MVLCRHSSGVWCVCWIPWSQLPKHNASQRPCSLHMYAGWPVCGHALSADAKQQPPDWHARNLCPLVACLLTTPTAAACRFVYETPMPVGRLVRQVADKHQVCTQRSWKRPFGVGMLVGGYDKTGPHLYNTCPSGNYYEYKAMAIGARSQVWC